MSISTCKVRLAYAHIETPAINKATGKNEYSAVLLVPKESEKGKLFIEKFKAHCDEIKASDKAKNKWGSSFNPARVKYPIKDSDEYETLPKGCWAINAKNTRLPDLRNAAKEVERDLSVFYSGCYVQATITVYPFAADSNKGLAVWLDGVRKISEGERFVGTVITEESYDDSLLDDEDDMFA